MNIDPTLVAMATGFLSMLIYVEGLRPLLIKGIHKFKSWWHMRQGTQFTNAEARGYGWAWAMAKYEDKSPYQIAVMAHPLNTGSRYARSFDAGVSDAVCDITWSKDSGLSL